MTGKSYFLKNSSEIGLNTPIQNMHQSKWGGVASERGVASVLVDDASTSEWGMTSLSVSSREGGVAYVPVNPSEEGVASLPISPSEEGVASQSTTPSEKGMASVSVSSTVSLYHVCTFD